MPHRSDNNAPAPAAAAAVAHAVTAIDDSIARALRPPSTASLAKAAGLSPYALRRAFLTQVGLTPKAYAAARQARSFREALDAGAPVTDALYGAGYTSPSRVYERHAELLGMTPAAYRKGAPGESIRYALTTSTLGDLVVGLTDTGVCYIAFGESADELLGELARRFSAAELVPAAPHDAQLVASVVALVDDPSHAPSLPLDVRGTVFQQRVWQALTRIEPGETVTYGELARRIGSPSAVRAVAQACGANPVAVAVPCHRVIGANGDLTGYRWGVERKKQLLQSESR